MVDVRNLEYPLEYLHAEHSSRNHIKLKSVTNTRFAYRTVLYDIANHRSLHIHGKRKIQMVARGKKTTILTSHVILSKASFFFNDGLPGT